MKKIFALLCVTLFSLFAIAQGEDDVLAGSYGENLFWKIEDDTLTIYGAGGIMTSASSSNRYSAPWLTFKNIKKLIIEDGVLEIGNYAFYMMDSIEFPVAVPASITKIGNDAFAYCHNIPAIELSPNISYIDNGTFNRCWALTELNIPDNVIRINGHAFYNCNNLRHVRLSSNLQLLDYCAFLDIDTTGIVSITLPNTVQSIGYDAFSNNKAIKYIFVKGNAPSLGSDVFSQTRNDLCICVDTMYYYDYIDKSWPTSKLCCHMSGWCSSNILYDVCILDNLVTLSLRGSGNIDSASILFCTDYLYEIEQIVLGDSILSFPVNLLKDGKNLKQIRCYRNRPPIINGDIGNHQLYENINLFVPLSSASLYESTIPWKYMNIQGIWVENPSSNTTQLSWLPVDSASLYKLRIYSEQIELDTTLLIEADSLNGGISIPVTLAPNRDRRMPMDDIGSVVVITLEPNSGATTETPFRVTVSTKSKNEIDILFDLEVLKGEKTIKQESGSFTLNAPIPNGLDEIPFSKWSISSGIYDLYGHRYTLTQWNQLPTGIYILREGEKASRVMKR